MADDDGERAMTAAVGYATILRHHAAEADKAASSDQPQKWVTGHRGWVVLRDQLREAAAVLEGCAFMVQPDTAPSEYGKHRSEWAEVVDDCTCRICLLHRDYSAR